MRTAWASGIVKWGAQGASGVLHGDRQGRVGSKAPGTDQTVLEWSLAQAENYIASHPDEAKSCHTENGCSYDDAYMTAVWSEHQFSLSLDQSLITAMEDEARWMIRTTLPVKSRFPIFMNYIYEDGLKAIKPEAVNIIR